jgi:hypothetical protein
MTAIFAPSAFPFANAFACPLAYSGIDGFIPNSRASIMLDVVFLAMFVVVPILAWSVRLAKKGRYSLHKTVQLTLGGVLLVAVSAFEVDMQFLTDWRERASKSPYYSGEINWVATSLAIHLFFAIPTALLWIVVIYRALRRFPDPPGPSAHSASHRIWANLATIEMYLTALTGWIFYALAFIA